jgi:hypothetical protein
MHVNKELIQKLLSNKELFGYESPSGRIAYNKIVKKGDFGKFTHIIASLAPLEVVNDSDRYYALPSIAKTLKKKNKHSIYPWYLYMNATMDEYMDYEDEEDQDNMSKLTEFVDAKKKTVIGITIQKSEAMGSAHASAFVCWKVGRHYRFAFYDPLSYKRNKKSYDFIERAFIRERFEQKIEFINLSKYCLHKESDFHCVQYVMNAEYCYIYALHFLAKWIDAGSETGLPALRKVVKATYVVDPTKLTRNNSIESMIFRLELMSFLCSSLIKYFGGLGKRARKVVLDVDRNVKELHEYVTQFKESYGVSLI